MYVEYIIFVLFLACACMYIYIHANAMCYLLKVSCYILYVNVFAVQVKLCKIPDTIYCCIVCLVFAYGYRHVYIYRYTTCIVYYILHFAYVFIVYSELWILWIGVVCVYIYMYSIMLYGPARKLLTTPNISGIIRANRSRLLHPCCPCNHGFRQTAVAAVINDISTTVTCHHCHYCTITTVTSS